MLHLNFLHVILVHEILLHVIFLHVILLHVIFLHVTSVGGKQGCLIGLVIRSVTKSVGYHVFSSRNVTNFIVEMIKVY
jgi:hypothetical protein